MFHGIFNVPPFDTITVNNVSLLEIIRTPLAINLGVFGVLFVLLVRQHHVRTSLIAFSLAALLVITGIPYAIGIITACLFIFFFSRLLKAWTDRSGSHRAPLITGWIVINAMLVACNLLVLLPFRSRMEWAEVTMFWGIAFMTLRSLHYIGQVCRGRIDPREVGSFKRFLHYLIHLPSFRFGPYQTFRQFTFEVDSCKQRINWKNTAYGLYRIGLGITKHLIIFHLIQRKFFYPEGFYGPYSTGMFEAAVDMSMSEAWFIATFSFAL